ncbi:MAG: glycoside hydrolase family 11 protein [Polyangiaceae bacterium]
MKLARIVLGSALLPACLTLVGCSSTPEGDGPGAGAPGTAGAAGRTSTGSAGSSPNGGLGGSPNNGPGGSPNGGSGGGASSGPGGSANGGAGGRVGGFGGAGGRTGSGGGSSAGAGGKAGGGSAGSAGASGGSTAGGSSTLDCSAPPAVPANGTKHSSSNASGKAAGLDWTIWSNGSGGSITTYDVEAFSAAWNNSGDFLARTGLQWNASKTYDAYGTITAQFAAKKTGTGGGYSYIGIYGWSVSPCVEYYIVDDSYNKMPVNPGSTTNKGTAMIDGGTYTLYTRATTGTGGSKCPGTSSWTQYYSVRQTARDCGQISITEHFKAWAAAGMPLGKMDQAQILVEVGGGSGSIDFSVASISATGG